MLPYFKDFILFSICDFFYLILQPRNNIIFEYLVHCGGYKKVIKPETKEAIEYNIRTSFKIPSDSQVTIQQYDPSWDDCIDVDDPNEMEDRGKLSVMVSRDFTVSELQQETIDVR